MREIWTHGPITAVMGIYRSPWQHKKELEHIMLYGGIYWKHDKGSYLHGYHAVLIVGWGGENGRAYWKCANSWGVSRNVISGYWTPWGGYETVHRKLAYPEKGYFRIARASNFCGIESQLYMCFSSALKA